MVYISKFQDYGNKFVYYHKVALHQYNLSSYIISNSLFLAGLLEVVTFLSLVCRAAMSSIYGLFYIYTALLFPTEVRQMALGSSVCIGSAVGLAAPYIAGPLVSI